MAAPLVSISGLAVAALPTGTTVVINASPKKKKSRPFVRKGKKNKPKVAPFSRPMLPLESDELATLMAGMELESGSGLSLSGGGDGTGPIRFEDMNLNPKLLQGIYLYGLEKPSPIQQRAILPCVKGRDVIVQAQSGMGKTATLAISLLQRLDMSNPQCQALVVAPTRELAEQICIVFTALGGPMGATTYACIGGTDIKVCKRKLLKGRQIVVGTTGRILHMIKDQNGDVFLNTDSVKTLGLDEADKMLTGEFRRDLTELFGIIPMKSQIILMSATMPENILKLTNRFMRNPWKFLVKNDELTLDGICQYYLNIEKEEWRLMTLSDIYNQISKAQGMIFCNSRQKVKDLSTKMQEMGHIVSAMRGDLQQRERELILKEFRTGAGASRMLITSDLLARGIDVQQVNLVINYEFPLKKEEYIHRVGRGGRYGRKGVAITFVTTDELEKIKGLEEFYNTQIVEMPTVTTLLGLLKVVI